MRKTIAILTAAALCGCAAVPPAQAPSPPTMSGAYTAVLQGEGLRAVAILESLDPATLSAGARDTRACMLARLTRREPATPKPGDAFLAATLAAYQEYWLGALRAEQAPATAEAALFARLDALVVASGGKAARDLDELEGTLAAMISSRGAYSLHGKTLPFREFMLWTKQASKTYDVALPESRQAVTVVFMDGFSSLGWAGFATCGVAHSGGWTKPDALYAVRSAYDLESESFRVSYLTHEGQHFSDNARFPGLEQPELEYRAKLAELAVANTTAHKLLEKFAANTSSDRGVPHSHANKRVTDEMGDWRKLDVAQINASAKKLLEADSRAR